MKNKENWQEQEIGKIIFRLVKAGFTIELNKKWFTIKETYKSTARDLWETKEIFSTLGGDYFEKDWLRITLDKLRVQEEKIGAKTQLED